MAKAVFDEIPLNLCMNTLMYRLLLNYDSEIELNDLRNYDTAVYKS